MATKKPSTEEKSLDAQIVEKRAELFEAKKSHRAGNLVNPRVIGSLRKDIARLMTQQNQVKEGK